VNEDTRRPDSEIDEPVFSSDDHDVNESESESDSGTDSSPVTASEPRFLPETGPESPGDVDSVVPRVEEPVFSPGDEPGVWQASEPLQEVPEVSDEPPEWEFPSDDTAGVEAFSEPSIGGDIDAQYDRSQATAAADSGWANIAPDSEGSEEARPATEYNYFEETPAAEVAASPPPTRKLGRTGPVWVLGGIALVLIAGLVWFGVSRLTGTAEVSTSTPSEPAVQQVAADAPTPAPPTNTPGPTPTPTPILLPINANVTVANTDGQGVLLRADPGRAGDFIQTVEEGVTMVVLDADPESSHSEYPVPLDGYLWYRMRVPGVLDEDGNPLVGWSASEFFVVDVP